MTRYCSLRFTHLSGLMAPFWKDISEDNQTNGLWLMCMTRPLGYALFCHLRTPFAYRYAAIFAYPLRTHRAYP